VSYSVRDAEDGSSVEVLRWSSPRLPAEDLREIPDEEERGAAVLADGLAGFGVTFLDEAGERVREWDSSQLAQSSQLPVAVEIEVALADAEDPDAEPTLLHRRVLLPLRPLDLEELLDPTAAVGGGSGEDEEEGEEGERVACESGPCATFTVCQAIDCAKDSGASAAQLFQEIGGQPFCRWRSRIPKSLQGLIRIPACR
jgi:hypothetical protein